MNTTARKMRILPILAHVLFWGFNLPLGFTSVNFGLSTLLAIVFSPERNFFDLKQFFQFVPFDIVLTFFVVGAMPLVIVLAALVTRSYKKPTRLLQILFGIEVPILSFTLARLVFLKTLTPINIFFLLTATISIISYSLYLFRPLPRRKTFSIVQLLAFLAATLVGVYASLLMFFFLPIVIAMLFNASGEILRNGFGLRYVRSFWELITGFVLIVSVFTLFTSLMSSPFIGLALYFKAFLRLKKILTKQKKSLTKKIVFGFASGYVFLAAALTFQGSMLSVNSRIESYQRMTNFNDRSRAASSLINSDSSLRSKLVNTYLAHYRYLTDSKMSFLQQGYIDTLKLDEPSAKRIQQWFTAAAFPFVYNGNFDEDVQKAGEYYQALFDEPIQLAQGKDVSRILSTSFNFSSDQMKSSVLDKEDTDVLLVSSLITAKPDVTNQFATVSIEEEYENVTNTEQEVFYLFSLPVDSVITDLRIGPDLELESEKTESVFVPQPTQALSATEVLPTPTATKFMVPQPTPQINQGEIAAKGAANQTIENQYRRSIDPAIVEQVGPQQYQLRVYPIPVKEENLSSWQRQRLTATVRNQKMRLTYVSVIDENGNVALPAMTQSRNVFHNNKTTFQYKTADAQLQPISSDATEIAVTAREESECGKTVLSSSSNGSTTLYIPHAVNPVFQKNPQLHFSCADYLAQSVHAVTQQRIAILADSSYSMGVSNWRAYLEKELPLNSLLENNVVDLYYFNDFVSDPISLNLERNNPKPWNQLAFGKTNRLQALTSVSGKYDLVLMFTDGSEADNAPDKNFVPTVDQSVYVIYKDSKLPKLPDDLTYQLLVNEGKAESSGVAALQDFAVQKSIRGELANRISTQQNHVVVGELGSWVTLSDATTADQALAQLLSGRQATQVDASQPAARLVAKRTIEASMRASASSLNQIQFLDSLNVQAQQAGIVTPFSSFIVLVTDQQREQLRAALQSDDRFLAHFDLGEEQLSQPTAGGALGTSAVPEPHEWILLFVTVGLVVVFGRKRLVAYLPYLHV